MSKELIQKAAAVFEQSKTPEKWDAFLELISYKEQIKAIWIDRLTVRLDEYFSKEGKIEGWEFNRDGNNMVWYLTDLDQNSLSIWWENLNRFSLWANGEYYNIEEITKQLQLDSFSVLLGAFSGVVKKFEGNYLISEYGNFSFGEINDGDFGNAQIENLAWYAGNKTDEFAKQIIEKVKKIRVDHLEIFKKLCYEKERKPR